MDNHTYPSCRELSLFDQLPGCWGCKDRDSVFVHVNQEYAELIGIPHPEDCIGLNYGDLPDPLGQFANTFQEQDRYVLKTGRRLSVLNVHPYSDGVWRAHLVTKAPWRDSQGNMLGTLFFAQQLKDAAVLEAGYQIFRAMHFPDCSSYSISSVCSHRELSLSPRESEALFLMLYGKKPQFIANVLGVTVKTFENYVCKLRVKFSASSKSELIEKAIDAGFGSHIPSSLFKKQLSVILKA
ncbi:helix-turn-helix transcriptional regulator [Parasalinivibrio latis]|uniref:helix-turn-helix transcriptional regulator n=1 Tax=Parasalinivibrio latis TaxID=2952610 RepID=UPI0030E458E3